MIVDMAGKRIGRLVVKTLWPKDENGKAKWLCKCDCGMDFVTTGERLRNGNTTSCGCFRRERQRELHLTHGYGSRHSPNQTYASWSRMISRCTNPKNNRWQYYGGRGIKFDPKWSDFSNFLKDMGERPKGFTIERNDVNGNYCASNCRWATPLEQARNKTNTVKVTYQGKTLTVSQWAEQLKVKYTTLRWRIKHHGIEEALSAQHI